MVEVPRVAVLDYGIGNLRSAQKALEKVGADARLTRDQREIEAADAVVLPGVGAFGACMDALRQCHLESVIHERIGSGVPFLGICVGMQMLFDSSQEDPGAKGLGVITGEVRWIGGDLPRPQMQWNRLHTVSNDPLLVGLGESPWMYFVHSLHGVPKEPSVTVATVRYGGELNVMFRRDNVVATQFHPEKSARDGLGLLANFVNGVRS